MDILALPVDLAIHCAAPKLLGIALSGADRISADLIARGSIFGQARTVPGVLISFPRLKVDWQKPLRCFKIDEVGVPGEILFVFDVSNVGVPEQTAGAGG